MTDEMNGAAAEAGPAPAAGDQPPVDRVLEAIDKLREQHLKGEVAAVAFCAVKPDGSPGMQGWAGDASNWGALLGFQIQLLQFRYTATICAAGQLMPVMSEVAPEDLPADVRAHVGLGPTEE